MPTDPLLSLMHPWWANPIISRPPRVFAVAKRLGLGSRQAGIQLLSFRADACPFVALRVLACRCMDSSLCRTLPPELLENLCYNSRCGTWCLRSKRRSQAFCADGVRLRRDQPGSSGRVRPEPKSVGFRSDFGGGGGFCSLKFEVELRQQRQRWRADAVPDRVRAVGTGFTKAHTLGLCSVPGPELDRRNFSKLDKKR